MVGLVSCVEVQWKRGRDSRFYDLRRWRAHGVSVAVVVAASSEVVAIFG